MRIFTTLVLTLLLTACGRSDGGTSESGVAAPESAPPAVAATWRGEGNVLEFSAWEMGCSGCESTIQKRVGGLDGVTSVAADKASAVVTVQLADGADRMAVAKKITEVLEHPETGKTFEIIEATP